jgi:NADPH-dependent 2,4-dienoyl-CoA reductase/sulfur reductase-like enzyme/rhodanese-related sulfurtransferase
MTKKKYLIIGGVAGGASVAARLRRLDEHADITMLERGRDVSFSNCALPYYLSREIESPEDLKLVSPKTFKDRYNIQALPLHEALSINRERKTVAVKNLETGEVRDFSYDVLFLSPGASPIMPPGIPGIGLPHVFSVRNVQDMEKIDGWLKEKQAKEVAVVGGGFIGLEVMENLVHAGYQVSLADMAPQVMLPFDEDMAQILHKEISDKGVTLVLGDGLKSIEEDGVTLSSGRRLLAQAVVMAIGVRPETKLAKDAGLEIGETGGILVNEALQTSDPSIYALGDAIQVNRLDTGERCRLALAGPALRQARRAANHVYGLSDTLPGVLGSAVIRVFGMNAASAGLNERQCRQQGLDYGVSFVIPMDKVSIMPGAKPLFFKLIYEKGSGRVLGAQAIGQGAADKRMDVVSTALRFGATIYDLKDLELCYAPVFSTARDAVNQAALAACNLEDGLVQQVMFTQVRKLVEEGAYLLDVREEGEHNYARVKGAVNIPLSQLRRRLDEIPRDRPIYIYCRSGQRSYNAARVLMQTGFQEVYNVAGSFLALSWYEAFTDRTTGREPIVTAYKFG